MPPNELKQEIEARTFIITDTCAWEANKQNKTSYTHAIQVVDDETGQIRWISSGSRIKFVGGNITDTQKQEDYNQNK